MFLDGTGNWSSPGGGVTDIIATAPLNASAATGSVTLSMPAYATATGGYVPSGGATGEYLDGLSGNWTSLPVSGVSSVIGDTVTISSTGGATPTISAITTGGVGSGLANLATGGQIQSAIDSALAGAVTFKGTFNANTGAITGGSDFLYNPGANTNTVPIAIGDRYVVSTAGNCYGVTALQVGEEVIGIAAAAINTSIEAGWNAVPSAGAGVVSVLPSSTGLVSTGQPLVITPAGGTGTVTIESTAYAGQSNVGHVPAGGSANKYLDGDTGSWLTLPAGYTGWTVQQDSGTNITVSSGATLPIRGVVTTGGAGISTDNNASDVNIALINAGGTPSSSTFYRGDGQWATPGAASATITTQNTVGNGTNLTFALGATPNGSSVNFVDAFIDGVYQEVSTYSISGTNLVFNAGNAPAAGTNVETKTTADYNVAAVVTTASLGQTNTTGNVNLRIIPNYIISNITAQANNLYIFDSTTTAYTITLPGSPSLGDSIKISNRGGLATNVLAANGNNIMGASTDLTINNVTAAFEIIWAAGSQGWVIIGNV